VKGDSGEKRGRKLRQHLATGRGEKKKNKTTQSEKKKKKPYIHSEKVAGDTEKWEATPFTGEEKKLHGDTRKRGNLKKKKSPHLITRPHSTESSKPALQKPLSPKKTNGRRRPSWGNGEIRYRIWGFGSKIIGRTSACLTGTLERDKKRGPHDSPPLQSKQKRSMQPKTAKKRKTSCTPGLDQYDLLFKELQGKITRADSRAFRGRGHSTLGRKGSCRLPLKSK